jgi:predicted ATPase
MLTTLAVAGYRSLRDLVLPLGRLTLVTGANGSGKSSLYRALRLLADASRNGAIAALAREGGLPSTLWAGPESVRRGRPVQGTVRTKPVALRLGFSGDDFGYAIDFGLPVVGCSYFQLDPEIKSECVWAGPVLKPSTLMVERTNQHVRTRDETGKWSPDRYTIGLTDSLISEFANPRAAPELVVLRERIRTWRFYDQLRTDAHAPARASQIGTRTPVLGHDGADLAAAIGRSSRSVTPTGCTGRSRTRSRVAGSMWRTAADGSTCGFINTVCCGHWERRNCRTGRCATCCWWRRC